MAETFPPNLEADMAQQPTTARDSRLANQPALRPVTRPPATPTPPTFDELAAQADTRDYRPLAGRIRDYLVERPELVDRLPDAHRDLTNL
ncbi:hypothetical protein [Streptomyces californicus]|uniref:hypothetical protein n=1 Tax=Streptomyces californicus TaxID=67351 RepID=UPI003722D46C